VIRPPAVAGLFYPRERHELARTVDAFLEAADSTPVRGLLGLVAPHAGYEYSGPVAASAFAKAPRAARVVLLGPSHFVPLDGLAVSSADAWSTPLGDVRVADDLRAAAVAAGARVDDVAHAREHALEVELPFCRGHAGTGSRSCPSRSGVRSPRTWRP
jgi:AmmeMemoRadiSam system protein B